MKVTVSCAGRKVPFRPAQLGSYVSRTEIHTSESLGTEPSAVLVVMPTEESKICNYEGTSKFSVK